MKVIFNVNLVLDVYDTDGEAMREAGLQEVRFRFDFEGTKILTMY